MTTQEKIESAKRYIKVLDKEIEHHKGFKVRLSDFWGLNGKKAILLKKHINKSRHRQNYEIIVPATNQDMIWFRDYIISCIKKVEN